MDMKGWKNFLIKKLNVPQHRIQCLLGSNSPITDNHIPPSHANIINVLYGLIYNSEIQQDDILIIYYAEHGSLYKFPQRKCTATGSRCCMACNCSLTTVEVLCPIDHDTMDDDGCWIPDISDRELNALLRQISYAKGHKITVIADCCYAGGMT
ncbi:uncharacterized protein EV420DRAFT_1652150 [Desarmillaria tabescens]|uniref:Uncharacterized protein n=1 Tax=Armillaria tabescens TaxID=1929756 RepID=A0AA39MKP2_ARMTA|nr:uncharacterized protein EV420DRAFT_1652150 [Desarmillaria tabescens]KAK0437254.1 hypothetical protein EV420DRAFT_1652150 [Desarmillaria tabescens]